MGLRTRLNLVMAGLSAAFVLVLIVAEIQGTRQSIREETEAANRVASQLLGRLGSIYAHLGGTDMVQQFLAQTGRVRANQVYLLAADGAEIYRTPPATYKAGREAPAWFTRLLTPAILKATLPLQGGVRMVIESDPSRSVLDAWDDIRNLASFGAAMLLLVNALAFYLVAAMLRPIPVIAHGLRQIEQGDLAFRLPPLPGTEARLIGAAFNRMASAVQDKVAAQRQAREAEARLEERREMSVLAEQRVEEERRLIAHELHDEFGQSVTAIRSLATAIVQGGVRESSDAEIARMIADEAAKLYDSMHGLIPRLAPLTLDSDGLAATLDNLIADWQRRHPAVHLALRRRMPPQLGSTVTLAVYRVVQEALINALRHARASHVDIDVEHDERRITVRVSDDGVGLGTDWTRPGHFGLRGLADRVQTLGGRFNVGNREPHGVALSAEIPIMVTR